MINQLKTRNNLDQTKGLDKIYDKYQALIEELNDRAIPEDLMDQVNEEVAILDEMAEPDKKLKKAVKKSYTEVLKLLREEIDLVAKNYHRQTWMVLGMTIFGVPIGVGIAAAIGNIGIFGAFLPVGMAIGIAIGSGMDKKALAEGRQLEVE